jgi:hypothetical protein
MNWRSQIVTSFAVPIQRKWRGADFISSIWVQWVMLPCYEGSIGLILELSCPLGTVAGQKFNWFQPEPSQYHQGCLKPVQQGNQHCWTISFPPHGSNEWCYHAMNALCGTNLGHVIMSSWHCHWPKVWLISARAKQIPRLFETSTLRKPLLDHFISSIWVQWVMVLCYEGLILDMLCSIGTVACQKFGRFQPEPSQNQGCLKPVHERNQHCWTISFPPYGSDEWCHHAMKAP